jgi:Mrp family chromosome partitioning ATPase
LPWLVEVLVAELGAAAVSSGVVLREAGGRLAFFSGTVLDEPTVERVTAAVQARLGVYARPDRTIASADGPGAQRVLTAPRAVTLAVGDVDVRLLDRRIVGADWLGGREERTGGPPRFAFASLKGGVGRSTAISVCAAEAARQGRNVLVVDLDLEAPGIGSMLLATDRLPRLGALDFLVEQNFAPLSGPQLDDFVGTSGLTRGEGLVDVVPVVGVRTLDAPQNYLAKLSRAMLEAQRDEGEPMPLRDKIRDMLAALEGRRQYDLVFVDARAGLAELAAGPLLGLGATVLLFGTAQPQTLEDLRYLFAHLQSLVAPGTRSPWGALRMVHAKAQSGRRHERFKDELWDLFSEYLYEGDAEGKPDLRALSFGASDPNAPHNPIAVPLDTAFADWDPIGEPDTLVETYYRRTFFDLLAFIDDRGAELRGP